jgi:dienelactone hydrolase
MPGATKRVSLGREQGAPVMAASQRIASATAFRAMLASLLAMVAALALVTTAGAASPKTVSFLSDDGTTKLVGYLFAPEAAHGPAPAVVMMHGRAGPYSSLAKGIYDATTLSKRTKEWAAIWSAQGYWALVVDGFGPRGYPKGFAAGTDGTRPAAVNEITVRPLDAYAGLKFLRSLAGVNPDRIAIQGWSNGGSATLASLSDDALAASGLPAGKGFRAALAFYPGCGLQGAFKEGYRATAPVRVFIGTDDEEVSPDACSKLVKKATATGSDIALTTYAGATHDFDDPGEKRQGVPANVAAAADARQQALSFFAAQLAP